jgi:hypothetical protein
MHDYFRSGGGNGATRLKPNLLEQQPPHRGNYKEEKLIIILHSPF